MCSVSSNRRGSTNGSFRAIPKDKRCGLTSTGLRLKSEPFAISDIIARVSDNKNKKIIVTHNGSFHSDEIFAVATLELMLGKDFEIEILRSRESADWENGDYVVDVGGVYDPSRQRFDHHQEGGAGGRENGVQYSSFGLVWKHYGEVVSGGVEVAKRVDTRLVQGIDAIDNGQDISKSIVEGVRQFAIGDYFMLLRPSWAESEHDYYKAFLEAVAFARHLLERLIIQTRGEMEGEEKVREQITGAPDKRIAEIDHNLPWESISMEFPNLLYVMYQDSGSNWRLKTVRKSLDSFESRKPLPAQWGGETGEDLQKITGVSDATFCHRQLFTCGAKSKEGVLALVKLALEA